ncbi:MAG: hypothetical protein ABR936_12005 [Bacteroidota bacterium]|jgi:hypothetical protein
MDFDSIVVKIKTPIPRTFIKDPNLTSTGFKVGIKLLDWNTNNGEKNQILSSTYELSQILGVERTSMVLGFKNLEKCGYIIIEPGGIHRPSLYRLLPKLLEPLVAKSTYYAE